MSTKHNVSEAMMLQMYWCSSLLAFTPWFSRELIGQETDAFNSFVH